MDEKYRKYEEIDVEKVIDLGEENIRKMTPEEFNALCSSIEENGFVEPIQVVKDGEKYRVVNGNHRFVALRDVFGWKKIPCVILGEMGKGDWTEEKYWQEAIRLNNIRGDFDPVLLAKKILELREKTKDKYSVEELKRRLGFTGKNTIIEKLFGQVARTLTPEQREELIKNKEKIQTVEDLSNFVNSLMAKYGQTVEKHYVYFSYGGKEHLVVNCDEELWEQIENVVEIAKANNEDIRAVFKRKLGVVDE